MVRFWNIVRRRGWLCWWSFCVVAIAMPISATTSDADGTEAVALGGADSATSAQAVAEMDGAADAAERHADAGKAVNQGGAEGATLTAPVTEGLDAQPAATLPVRNQRGPKMRKMTLNESTNIAILLVLIVTAYFVWQQVRETKRARHLAERIAEVEPFEGLWAEWPEEEESTKWWVSVTQNGATFVDVRDGQIVNTHHAVSGALESPSVMLFHGAGERAWKMELVRQTKGGRGSLANLHGRVDGKWYRVTLLHKKDVTIGSHSTGVGSKLPGS